MLHVAPTSTAEAWTNLRGKKKQRDGRASHATSRWIFAALYVTPHKSKCTPSAFRGGTVTTSVSRGSIMTYRANAPNAIAFDLPLPLHIAPQAFSRKQKKGQRWEIFLGSSSSTGQNKKLLRILDRVATRTYVVGFFTEARHDLLQEASSRLHQCTLHFEATTKMTSEG